MQKINKILRIALIMFILTGNPSLLLSAHSYSQSPVILAPDYINLLQQRVMSCFIYPREAKLKNWEGIVKVIFTLAQNGRLKEIDIAQSSGYPLLDAAAILAVKDAGPYPFPKDYNYGREGELKVAISLNYPAPALIPEQYPLPILSTQEEPALTEPLKELSIEKPVVKETLAIETNRELSNFVNIALQNNQPAKAALEEVELAKLKITEAQRGLFPAVKVQAYNTNGEVYKVDYEEREAKVQVDQPLFYGGRLGDTINQAKTNLEITQKNYDRLKFDVLQKAEIAYYNLIAARMNLNQQEILRQEAAGLLEKMEKLVQADMLIPLEINSARSWLNQLEFKLEGIKHDLYLAELTFKQVLNVQQSPEVETQVIQAETRDFDLPACLAAAYKYRPEVYLSEQMVKFNDYGKKIELSKKKALTIDLTSSYGNYQGHFKTEPWKKSSNWYVGLKGSLPWEANTLNSSFTSESTEPRMGQTAPTKSTTLSGEFNLLDNTKRLSDKKKADIDLLKSVSDLNEAFKTITFEVEDALLNYKKAVLQLNTAQAEMKFRRNETEVAKIRAMVGETSLSGAMESLYSFSEAQSKYTQALANYQISLANLKKATGYGLQI